MCVCARSALTWNGRNQIFLLKICVIMNSQSDFHPYRPTNWFLYDFYTFECVAGCRAPFVYGRRIGILIEAKIEKVRAKPEWWRGSRVYSIDGITVLSGRDYRGRAEMCCSVRHWQRRQHASSRPIAIKPVARRTTHTMPKTLMAATAGLSRLLAPSYLANENIN